MITMPNADTGGNVIIRLIRKFVASHDSAFMVDNFGMRDYSSMMALSAAMVGNSSSGIIEAASFKLPVVNIGIRQLGRVQADNVINVNCDCAQILKGIRKAVGTKFRENLSTLINPYGDGSASERIVAKLMTIDLNDALLRKRFCDMASAQHVNGVNA